MIQDTSPSDESPDLVIAVINSNITAIAAELVSDLLPGGTVMAISRRGCKTRLSLAGDGEKLERQFAPRKISHSRKRMRAFDSHFSDLSHGKPFDVLICHGSDPLSQLLITHPLCRKFFYIEEGLTASVGKRLGRKGKPGLFFKGWLWKLKSTLFFDGRISKYTPNFYDTHIRNYGGAYALSLTAFKGFPGRIQLPFSAISSTGHDAGADVLILMDSQYFIGGCEYEDYKAALLACLGKTVKPHATIAVKFHPAEKKEERKNDLKNSLAALPEVTSVKELPSDFIAERMAYRATTSVIVGTSALGLYMGTRGFHTVTFAHRLRDCSAKIAGFIDDIPQVFFDVCEKG